MPRFHPARPTPTPLSVPRQESRGVPTLDDSLLQAWRALPDADPVIVPTQRTASSKPQHPVSEPERDMPHRDTPVMAAPRVTILRSWPNTGSGVSQNRPVSQRPRLQWFGLSLALVVIGLALTFQFSAPVVVHETRPIQVQALLNNRPMPGAQLTLHPLVPPNGAGLDNQDPPIVGRGLFDESGACSPVINSAQSGLPTGEYIASISWFKVSVKEGETVAGPDLVPQVFRSPATSPLRVMVTDANNSLVTLRLTNLAHRKSLANYDHE